MEELKLAKEIIDILQQELYNTVASESEHESNYSQRKETTKQNNSTEWITVPAKYTSAKPSRSNISVSSTIKQNIESWNKYTLLHNLRDSSAVLNDLQSHSEQRSRATLTSNQMASQHEKERKIPTIVNGIQQLGEDQKLEGMKASEWTHFSTLQRIEGKIWIDAPKSSPWVTAMRVV
jgi:hypothetical protein